MSKGLAGLSIDELQERFHHGFWGDRIVAGDEILRCARQAKRSQDFDRVRGHIKAALTDANAAARTHLAWALDGLDLLERTT